MIKISEETHLFADNVMLDVIVVLLMIYAQNVLRKIKPGIKTLSKINAILVTLFAIKQRMMIK